MKLIISCLSLSLSLLPAAARAQAEPPTEPEPPVVYARRTVVDFSSMVIQGDVDLPSGAYVVVKKKPRFRSLVRVRGGFLPEILRAVDAL